MLTEHGSLAKAGRMLTRLLAQLICYLQCAGPPENTPAQNQPLLQVIHLKKGVSLAPPLKEKISQKEQAMSEKNCTKSENIEKKIIFRSELSVT